MRKASIQQRRQLQKEKMAAVAEEVEALNARLAAVQPARGTNPLAEDLNTSADKTPENFWPMAKEFAQLPLSSKTLRGLETGKFKTMTDVQRATLPHALVGRDILGAAKTGSGKTLAFLIPVLEKLYRLRWTNMDGLGALIISPTRELAMQTFSVLRAIGAPHSFSAGLLIGGTQLKAEQNRVGMMNIIVATPGRLLQHMDETPTFRTETVQILVLDEADQILSGGFQREVNAIINNLPQERQTLLFSATQTTSVKDLARLSLDHPEFLSVHAEADMATPDRLVQNYIIASEGDKLNILWSFIKAHLRKKILVFVQSQRQVQFIWEAFRHLSLGTPVLHLRGAMGQQARLDIYRQFDKAKFALLVTTDVAARGLDFEGVSWVIQLDCPDSTDSYIHRVGRTARNGAAGRSTLFLLPSEVGFREKLLEAKIPVSRTNINPARILQIDVAIQALLIQKPEYKVAAQKALKSYLKSVYLQSDKSIFDITKIDMEALAHSYGLLQVPHIRFVDVKRTDKNTERLKSKMREMDKKLKAADATGDEDDDTLLALYKKDKEKTGHTTKLDKLLKKKNMDVLSESYSQFRPEKGNAVFDFDDDESDDDVLVPKKKTQAELELEEEDMKDFVPTEKKEKKERVKIHVHKESSNLVTFEDSDDEEEEIKKHLEIVEADDAIPFPKRVAQEIAEHDDEDRKALALAIRERKRKRKEAQRLLEQGQSEDEDDVGVELANPMSESDEEGSAHENGSSDDGSDGARGGRRKNGFRSRQDDDSASGSDVEMDVSQEGGSENSDEMPGLIPAPRVKSATKHYNRGSSKKFNSKYNHKKRSRDDRADRDEDMPRKKKSKHYK